jgi:hypothetical protein
MRIRASGGARVSELVLAVRGDYCLQVTRDTASGSSPKPLLLVGYTKYLRMRCLWGGENLAWHAGRCSEFILRRTKEIT